MHYNLEFLETGQAWPPIRSRARIERYNDNLKLWKGEHAVVFDAQLRRIDRAADGWRNFVGFPVVPNIHRLVTIKTADLLAGEPPDIKVSGADESKQLQDFLDKMGWSALLHQIGIDLSRYGNAVLSIHHGSDGTPEWGLVSPGDWFPITDGSGSKIVSHVIAYPTGDGKRLCAWIHTKGDIEEREYELVHGRIGDECKERKHYGTGLSGFAVFAMQGAKSSDSLFGADDYLMIDSLISELIVELGNVARVLDKHAAPCMSGPSGVLEDDGYGRLCVPSGQYFVRDDESEPEVKYITWDGHLDAAFTYIGELLQLIYVVSEMGEVLLGSMEKTGVTTYRGLKLRMTSALSKVRRLANGITQTMKEAICALVNLDGGEDEELLPESITIVWNDGLPDELCDTCGD